MMAREKAPAAARSRPAFRPAPAHRALPTDAGRGCACGGTCPKCRGSRPAHDETGAAAAAPAAPAPTTGGTPATKTVSIDLVGLRGNSRSRSGDVTFANTVWAPCHVQFSVGGNNATTTAQSDGWLGGDTDITVGTCSSAHAEETGTYTGATTAFSLGSRLRAFYTGSITSGSSHPRGNSRPPYCATGTASGVLGMLNVSSTGADRTLAHEIGHILLDSGTHPTDTGNLMHPTNTATGNQLTATQCATAYANA